MNKKNEASATTLTISNDVSAVNYSTESAIFSSFQQAYPDAPDDLLEWIAKDLGGSAIAPEIALANFTPVWDEKTIAKLLGWRGYFDEPGWFSGDLTLLERQFKPKKPHISEDRKTRKYLTSKKGYDAALLKAEGLDWNATADDPTEPIIITEGAKKAASLISRGYKAISLPGVDMGHKRGKRGVELVPGLERFAVAGRPIILAFDSDITEKTEVQGALINLAATLFKKRCVVTVWTWLISAGKGIDDVIVNGNFDQVKDITYKEFVQKLEKQFSSEVTETSNNNQKKYDTDWADEITELHRDSLSWDSTAKEWRKYEKGIWSVISEEEIVQIIKSYIQSQGKGCRMGQISSIEKLMRANLYKKEWDENPNLIPFEDGNFDLESNKLLPHSPTHNLTWQLPRQYHSEAESWGKIDSWLTLAVQGKQRDKDILIAFAAATLRRRADLHKFLLIQGPGGSGKSSYIRLVEDLVGGDNHYSSSLSEWNNTRFEAANGYGKSLISFPDENGKTRNIEGFKKLTGQDLVRFEEKGKKATNYRFNGMVIVASNNSPFVGGSISAIARRKIEVFFNTVVPASQRRDLNAEFHDELPAFTRHLLSLDNEWITQVLRNQQGFGSLTAANWDNQCQNDSIAAWLDEWVIFDSSACAPIGNQKAAQDDTQNECLTLYQSYTLYCSYNGYQPKSTRRFSADLLELGTVLSQNWEKIHTRDGKKIQGVRLRNSKLDVKIPTYTEILEGRNQPNNQPVTDSVTDGDGCVTDCVTDGTYAVTGCDGCDGLNPTFSKKSCSEAKSSQTDGHANNNQIASKPSDRDIDTQQQKKSLVAESTKQVKELKRSCYPSMSDHEYNDRFRNLLLTLYGVPDRSQMTLEQLKDFLSTLVFWNRQGAKFNPQGWQLIDAIAPPSTATKSSPPKKRWHGSSDTSKRDRLLAQIKELKQRAIARWGEQAREDIDSLVTKVYGRQLVPLEKIGEIALEVLLEEMQHYILAKDSVVT